jgi:hypothetical protein
VPLFPTPSHLVCFYDPDFFSRQHRFANWQLDVHHDFSFREHDRQKQMLIVAPNGAGKSAMILAPMACFTALSYFEGRCVVTSASADQLDKQTLRATDRLAHLINKFHKADLFDIRQRQIKFRPHHSIIEGHKSDKEGTQEGFHPLGPGREFTILVDEGKSIPDDIYSGILKWTGSTRRVDISSAGEPAGNFYRMLTEQNKLSKYIITDDMCPYYSAEDRERIIADSGGPDSIIARQSLKSQFVSLAGTVVLTLDAVQRCIRLGKELAIEHKPEDDNKAGLDLSGGGDETVMSIWNGNKQLAIEVIQSRETTFQVERIISLCRQYGLKDPNRRKADAGGQGKQILDLLARAGWPWVRIYNQSKPVSRSRFNFGNRGTDMWFRFGRLVEDNSVILIEDHKQTLQLSTRRYRQRLDSDKIILMPKPECKAQGLPSPDRADAAVLALDGYLPPEAVDEKKVKGLTGDELEQWFDDLTHGKFVDNAKLDGSITLEQLVGMRGKK